MSDSISDLPNLIDELGTLEAELAATGAKKKIERCESLRLLIRDMYHSSGPDVTVSFETKRFALFLGPKSRRTVFKSKAAVFKMLGAQVFRELAEISLKKLATVLSGQQLDSITVQEQSGTRFLRVTKLEPKA